MAHLDGDNHPNTAETGDSMRIDAAQQLEHVLLHEHAAPGSRIIVAYAKEAHVEDPDAPVKGNQHGGMQTRSFALSDHRSAARFGVGLTRHGYDVWFNVALSRNDRRRQVDVVGTAISLANDQDGGGEYPDYARPTLMAESSPGKVHAYWRLKYPVSQAMREDLSARLGELVGADPSKYGPTSLLRLAGTRNLKYGRDIESAHEVKAYLTGADSYDPYELDRLLPQRFDATVTNGTPGSDEPTIEDYVAGYATLRSDWREENDRYIANIVCPFEHEHSEGAGNVSSTSIWQRRNDDGSWGPYVGKCLHAHCAGRGWQDFKRELGIPAGSKTLTTSGRTHDDKDDDSRNADKAGRKSQAVRLIEFVREDPAVELVVNQHGEPYALVSGRPVPLDPGGYNWLTLVMLDRGDVPPGNDALATTMRTLAALAGRDGRRVTMHDRTAQIRDGARTTAVYHELRQGRYVEVTADGWRVTDSVPAIFRPNPHALDLPDPAPNGDLDALRPFIRTKSERDGRLLPAHIVTMLLSDTSRAILAFTGVAGSAKTTGTRTTKRIVDPSSLEFCNSHIREIGLQIARSPVAAFDNQSAFSDAAQDVLAVAVTGGNIASRELYTNHIVTGLRLKSAIIINGVNNPGERNDIMDRTLPITLDRIPPNERRDDAEIEAEFYDALPVILGGIYDALSTAMRVYPRLAQPPRLAEWGRFVAGVYEHMGWGAARFEDDWAAVVERQTEAVTDADPVAALIVQMMQTRDEFRGTASELLSALEDAADDPDKLRRDRAWPKAANALSRRLNDVTPALEHHMLKVSRESEGKSKKRIIVISRVSSPRNPAPVEPNRGSAATASGTRTATVDAYDATLNDTHELAERCYGYQVRYAQEQNRLYPDDLPYPDPHDFAYLETCRFYAASLVELRRDGLRDLARDLRDNYRALRFTPTGAVV